MSLSNWRLAVPGILLLLLLILAGCDSTDPLDPGVGPEGIALTVTDTLYQTGDTIEAILTNESEEDLSYNLCLFGMQRRAGNRWERVVKHPDVACPLIARGLSPGQSDTLEVPVRADMEPGVYRFRDEIEFPRENGQRMTLVSNEFRVKEGV